jgi:hypothetical protein
MLPYVLNVVQHFSSVLYPGMKLTPAGCFFSHSDAELGLQLTAA